MLANKRKGIHQSSPSGADRFRLPWRKNSTEESRSNTTAHHGSHTAETPLPKRKKTAFAAAALAAALAVGGFGAAQMATAADGATSQGVIEKVSDVPTDWNDHMSEPLDTSEVGRIITDKTVRKIGFDAIDRETGYAIVDGASQSSFDTGRAIGDNFTVTFSALSSGGTISGESPIPVDVVFILDFSTSMRTYSNGTLGGSYKEMIEATNESIDALLAANPQNRVAVVAFSNQENNVNTASATTTLVPLGTYTRRSDKQYIYENGYTTYNNSRYPRISSNLASASRYIYGATNTPVGLYRGMEVLANASDTKVTVGDDEYNRIAGVILMSDGDATRISSTASWWQPTDSYSGYTAASPGPAFMSAITGSYMRDRVAEHYGGTISDDKKDNDNIVVYTVGIGLGDLETDSKEYATVALNPKASLASAAAGSGAATIRGYWTTYHANNSPSISIPTGQKTTTSYTVNHPTGTYAAYDPSRHEWPDYNDEFLETSNDLDLAKAFSQAVSLITTRATAPTKASEGQEFTSGYLKYTDTLGELMEVKEFQSILWVDHRQYLDEEGTVPNPDYGKRHEYNQVNKSTSGKVDTYVFSGTTHSSWLYDYEDVDLSNIIIKVDRSGAQEVVTIEIPPALLPMVEYEIVKDGDTVTKAERNEQTAPIKINYIVGPKEGVVEQIAGIKDVSDAALKAQIDAYVAKESNIVETEDKSAKGVALYTNSWTAGSDEAVVAYAEFEINPLNNFYSFTGNTKLYKDANGSEVATEFVAGTTYYYEKVIYDVDTSKDISQRQGQTRYLPVSMLEASETQVIGGELYALQGAKKDLPEITPKAHETEHGTTGVTDTMPYRLRSHWENGLIHQHQGNNGRLLVSQPGSLKLDKTVIHPTLDGANVDLNNESIAAKEFTFNIKLEAPSESGTGYEDLTGTHEYVITNPDLEEGEYTTGKINGATLTIKLKEDDTLEIKNLPDGTRYTITEPGSSMPAGFSLTESETKYLDENGNSKTEPGVLAEDGKVVGVVTSGETANAEFTNEYKIDPDNGYVTLEHKPEVEKIFTTGSRGLKEADAFTFVATPHENNPAQPSGNGASTLDGVYPQTLTIDNSDTWTEDSGTHTAKKSFTSVVLTKPGTYNFRISENASGIAGVTDSRAVRMYTIKVIDDGDGTLSVASGYPLLTKVMDDSGSPASGAADEEYAIFRNSYSESEITVSAIGDKVYTDTTGTKPLTDSMFSFELRPNFDKYTTDEAIAAVPMPASASGTGHDRMVRVYATTPGGDFDFGDITFEKSTVFSDADDYDSDGKRSKTFYYVVQEELPSGVLDASGEPVEKRTVDGNDYAYKDGMYYDYTRHLIEITVTDDGTDLSAEVTYTRGASASAHKVIVRNTYEPDSVVTDDESNVLSVEKELVGRAFKSGEKFEFTLVPGGANAVEGIENGTIVLPGGNTDTPATSMTAYAEANGKVTFEDITFKRAGTFTFSISEKKGDDAAIDYDTHSVNAIVTVGIDPNDAGKLKITNVRYTGGSEKFVNTYHVEPVSYGSTGGIEIDKMVVGRTMIANKYEFTIEAENDNAKAKTPSAIKVKNATSAADGLEGATTALTDLTFALDDAGKTFVYKIKETNAGSTIDGVQYASDGHGEQTVTFEVNDKGDGTLEVKETVSGGSSDYATEFTSTSSRIVPARVHFKNTYEPEAYTYTTQSFTKTIDGRDWSEDDEFTFKVEALDGAPQTTEPEVTVKGSEVTGDTAVFGFGTVTFRKPGTYRYKVTEVDPNRAADGLEYDSSVHEVTVTVTDNGDGKLTARSTSDREAFAFVNTYHAQADFSGDGKTLVDVGKTLAGRAMRDRDFIVDIKPYEVLDDEGEVAEGYASVDETVALFGIRKKGETIAFGSAAAGEQYKTELITGVVFTEKDAGKTYAFEVKEFVPEDATEGTLDGKTYKTRDGVYYNTNGIDHYRLEIKVTDDGKGSLKVETTWIGHDADHAVVDGKGGSATNMPNGDAPVVPFENTYAAQGTATINTIKDLEGRSWTGEDAFTFKIERMQQDETSGKLVEADGDLVTPLPTGTLTAKNDTDAVGSDGSQHHAVRNPDASSPADYKSGWELAIKESDLAQDQVDGIMKGDFYYRITENIATGAQAYEKNADGSRGNKVDGTTYDPATTTAEDEAKYIWVKDGVRYSSTPRYVHVHAEDTRTGSITTDVNYVADDAPDVDLGATPVFTNYYNPSGTIEIPVQKVVSGRADGWTDDDTYTFTIGRLNSAYPDIDGDKTLTIDKDTENHTAKFGKITFTQVGTYNYLIAEKTDSAVPGVEFDANTERRARIVVTDDGKGNLGIDSIRFYTDSNYSAEQSGDQDKAVFTNTYKASSGEIDTNKDDTGAEGKGIFSTTKELVGRKFRTGDTFSFAIEGSQGAPLPSTTTVTVAPEAGTETATFGFGTIEFTQADAGKTYIYTIKEIMPTVDENPNVGGIQYEGITYDEHEEKVEIHVVDNGDGTIAVNATKTNDGAGDTTAVAILFRNLYGVSGTAEVKAIKDLRGRDWTSADAFAFAIEPVKVDGSRFVDFTNSAEDRAALAKYPANTTEYPTGQTNATAKQDNMQQVATGQYFAVPAWSFRITQANLDATTGIGDFYYKITEIGTDGEAGSGGTADAITYSEEVYYAHIHAVDDGRGTIKTTLTYETAPGKVKGATPVFTNIYVPKTATIQVTKAWAGDSENIDRRTDVVVHLYYLDTVTGTYKQVDVEPLTLATGTNHEGDLTGSWDVPIYAADGTTKITYRVLEESVDGYRASYTGNENIQLTEGETARVGIENSIDETTTSVSVAKVWDDANDQDGVRPVSVVVALKAGDSPAKDSAGTDIPSLVLSAENNWTGTFTDVPINSNGTPIDYTVEEGNVAGYTTKVEYGTVDTAAVEPVTTWSEDKPDNWNGEVRVTNTHTPETHDTPVDPTDPDGEKVGITATKVWDDSALEPGEIQHAAVTLHLYGRVDGMIAYEGTPKIIAADAQGAALTVSWGGVPKKLNGKDVAYEVVEDAVPGYTTAVNGNVADGFTVTNTAIVPEPETPSATTTVTATKVWDDGDNRDGLRSEVKFKLVRRVGGGAVEDVVDGVSGAIVDDGASFTWSDLPVTTLKEVTTTATDPDTGEETTETTVEYVPVLYSVQEVDTPSGYEAVVVATGPGTFEVRNVHIPETIGAPDGPIDPADPAFAGIKVAKVWSDAANNKRPGSVSVVLQQRATDAGDDAWVDFGEPRVLAQANGWQAGWTGLPRYAAAGVAFEYAVREADVPSGYSAAVSGTAADGFTVTNTGNAQTSVKVVKTWKDENGNVLDAAPAAATFQLMKKVGDEPATAAGDTVVLPAGTAPADLVYIWDGLDAVDGGQQVVYSVAEVNVDGYTTTWEIETNADGLVYRFTNTKQAGDPEPGSDPEPGPDPEPSPDPTPDPDPQPAAGVFVSFVDALQSAGDQVLKFAATTLDVANDLDAVRPDTDPDHAASGHTFVGWDKNVTADDEGNTLVTYVARYQDASTQLITVSYVDPQADAEAALLKSEQAADSDAVVPYDPSRLKHESMQFVGWTRTVDAAGNVVYAAKYAADCANSPANDDPKDDTPKGDEPASSDDPKEPEGDNGGDRGESTPSSSTSSVPRTTPAAAAAASASAARATTAKTADAAPVAAFALLAVASGAALVATRRLHRCKGAGALQR